MGQVESKGGGIREPLLERLSRSCVILINGSVPVYEMGWDGERFTLKSVAREDYVELHSIDGQNFGPEARVTFKSEGVENGVIGWAEVGGTRYNVIEQPKIISNHIPPGLIALGREIGLFQDGVRRHTAILEERYAKVDGAIFYYRQKGYQRTIRLFSVNHSELSWIVIQLPSMRTTALPHNVSAKEIADKVQVFEARYI